MDDAESLRGVSVNYKCYLLSGPWGITVRCSRVERKKAFNSESPQEFLKEILYIVQTLSNRRSTGTASRCLGQCRSSLPRRLQESVSGRIRILLDLVSYGDVRVQSNPFILEETSVYWLNVRSKSYVVEE